MNKFHGILHCIINGITDKHKPLGATKLNKILWYIEQFHFLEKKKSLMNIRFVKRERGPAPEWTVLKEGLAFLAETKKITIKDNQFHGYKQKFYESISEPTIKLGSDEKKLIDEIVDIIATNHTATSISELSHDEIWEMAEIGEELPIYTCLVSKNGETNNEMEQWALGCVQ